MTEIIFNQDDLSVKYRGESIQLLNKEFALLFFLYNNLGKTYSREKLLDQLWPLTDSFDRTVDDHIYRLRKKLKKIDVISIQTIRSNGYRLLVSNRMTNENVLLEDSEYRLAINLLFKKYITYGQGKGLVSLVEQQGNIDIFFDQDKKLYLKFVNGDFHQIVKDLNIPLLEKAFYMLHIYSVIQFNTTNSLTFIKEVLAENMLPSHFQQEVAVFNIIGFYLKAAKYEEAKRQIAEAQFLIQKQNNRVLEFYLLNFELRLLLYTCEFETLGKKIELINKQLSTLPYLREKAIFFILNGLYLFITNIDKEKGNHLVEKGLNILEDSGFLPSYLNGLHEIIYVSNHFKLDMKFTKPYLKKWKDLDSHYRFNDLQKDIEKLFCISV